METRKPPAADLSGENADTEFPAENRDPNDGNTVFPDQSDELPQGSILSDVAPDEPGGHIVHGGSTPRAPGFRGTKVPTSEPKLNISPEKYDEWYKNTGRALIEQKKNDRTKVAPAESFIWKSLKSDTGRRRTNGLQGNVARYYEWDFGKSEIEVYDQNKKHIGAIDGLTGQWSDQKEPGRKVEIDDETSPRFT